MAFASLRNHAIAAFHLLAFAAITLGSPINNSSAIQTNQLSIDSNGTSSSLGSPRQPWMYNGRQGPVMFIGYGMPPGGPWDADVYRTFPDQLEGYLRATRTQNRHSVDDPLPSPIWILSDLQGQMRFMLSTTDRELHYSHVEDAIQGFREWLRLWDGEVVPSTSFYLIKGYGADARRLTNGMVGGPVGLRVEAME